MQKTVRLKRATTVQGLIGDGETSGLKHESLSDYIVHREKDLNM